MRTAGKLNQSSSGREGPSDRGNCGPAITHCYQSSQRAGKLFLDLCVARGGNTKSGARDIRHTVEEMIQEAYLHTLSERRIPMHHLPIALVALLLLMTLGQTTLREAEPELLPQLTHQPGSDWINARANGAIGDGVADDTAALQKLIDRILTKPQESADAPRVLYLPAGTYRITRTLQLGKSYGGLLVGDGRKTVLAWDGPENGILTLSNGFNYARYVGLTWDGRGKAAIGQEHRSDEIYETMIHYEQCAFLNLREHGVLIGRDQKLATAEVRFQNCLFARCGNGVTLLEYNDYDYFFDGCEFSDCGIGINSIRGNFIVFCGRFERSRVVDVLQRDPSHTSSLRNVVSQGSRRFFETGTDVHQPMRLDNCRIDRWSSDEGAVVLGRRGPTLLTDCAFTNPPGTGAPIRLANTTAVEQQVVLSNNTLDGQPWTLEPTPGARILNLPTARVPCAPLSPAQRFLTAGPKAKARVFDAVRDFGAKPNGSSDSTEALQSCIDAAGEAGGGAIAYLPTGTYMVSKTLLVRGGGYEVRGTGWRTTLSWKGKPDGTVIEVVDPQGIALRNLGVSAPLTAVRILQRGGAAATSSVFYDNLVVGDLQSEGVAGLWCQDLPAGALVRFGQIHGKKRFTNCGQATLIGQISYFGLVVEGKTKSPAGFCGFMFSNDACHTYAIEVHDNQDLVIGDFYVESNKHYLLATGGAAPAAPGRISLGVSKMSTTEDQAMDIRGYRGRIGLFGGDWWNQTDSQRQIIITQSGAPTVDLLLVGSALWSRLKLKAEPSLRLTRVGNIAISNNYPAIGKKSLPEIRQKNSDETIIGALDHFRALNANYLRAFHPDTQKAAP